jgi:O-succinylbenzoate synthase
LKIESVVITHVRVPLVEPFRISSGSICEKDGIVIELHGEGFIGIGESSPMAGSFYSFDTPESSWQELNEVVIPAIVGKEFSEPQDLNVVLDTLLAGNFTKTGVETAFWDLLAQFRKIPLHRLLGGTRNQVESGLAVGLYDDITDLLRMVERQLTRGYRRIKLKIEPNRDIEVVRAARKAFGTIPMSVDANGAYTLRDRHVFRCLDEFDLLMVEQPFPASFLEEMAELQDELKTAICLDESLHSEDQLQLAIKLGSFRIANFKIQRIGGFYHALEMYRICEEHGIGAWVGCMPELGVGQAQGAALASLNNFIYPTDVEASDRWFRDDITNPLIRVEDGMIELPETPGLGYALDRARMGRYQVAAMSFPN